MDSRWVARRLKGNPTCYTLNMDIDRVTRAPQAIPTWCVNSRGKTPPDKSVEMCSWRNRGYRTVGGIYM